MAADFNKPTLDDEYVNVLPQVRDNDAALAKMFNGVSVSNIPVNAVRFQGGAFSLWNGLTWNTQAISLGAGGTGATSASGARTNLNVLEAGTGASQARTNTQNDAQFVAQTRQVNTTAPLAGGGSLSGNLTLSIGNASTTAKGVVEKATSAELAAGTADKFPDSSEIKNYVDTNSAEITNYIGFIGSTSVTNPGSGTGTIKIARAGDVITVSSTGLTHSSSTLLTLTGVLPSDYRPSALYFTDSNIATVQDNIRISISSAGTIEFRYYSLATGATINRTSTSQFTFSFCNH